MASPSHPTGQLIKTPEVLRLLRIGRKRLSEAVEAGLLPPPVSLGPRCRLWDVEAIRRHLAQRSGGLSPPPQTQDAPS